MLHAPHGVRRPSLSVSVSLCGNFDLSNRQIYQNPDDGALMMMALAVVATCSFCRCVLSVKKITGSLNLVQ